jgi:hypothetical protein
MTHAYRVLARLGGDHLLHLISDEAEASLCGLPRVCLGTSTQARDVVCPDCLEWLPKRIRASEIRRRPVPWELQT